MRIRPLILCGLAERFWRPFWNSAETESESPMVEGTGQHLFGGAVEDDFLVGTPPAAVSGSEQQPGAAHARDPVHGPEPRHEAAAVRRVGREAGGEDEGAERAGRSASAATAASSVMSQAAGTTSPERSAATAAAAASSRSASSRRRPRPARSLATAAPMPLPAPITTSVAGLAPSLMAAHDNTDPAYW